MQGSCLCGAIRFAVKGNITGGSVCHCGQCRKQSGHLWASNHAPDADLVIDGPVTWYHSSDQAKRGFCGTCGAFLFWKHAKDDHTSFSLGAVDAPTGLTLHRHIFTADKGDYYDITDDLPQS